jgi:hypothetical protein
LSSQIKRRYSSLLCSNASHDDSQVSVSTDFFCGSTSILYVITAVFSTSTDIRNVGINKLVHLRQAATPQEDGEAPMLKPLASTFGFMKKAMPRTKNWGSVTRCFLSSFITA